LIVSYSKVREQFKQLFGGGHDGHEHKKEDEPLEPHLPQK
jgi:hypothetical protein